MTFGTSGSDRLVLLHNVPQALSDVQNFSRRRDSGGGGVCGGGLCVLEMRGRRRERLGGGDKGCVLEMGRFSHFSD